MTAINTGLRNVPVSRDEVGTGHELMPIDGSARGGGGNTGSSRCIGTLYGRIFVDISKSRQAKWILSKAGDVVFFARSFGTPRLRVVYAFAENRESRDMDTIVEAAMREAGSAPYPRIMKLYVHLPGDALPKKRNHLKTIGGKTYFILPSHGILCDRIYLGECYETFLSWLGQHSRRNIRNVRRHAAQSGITHHVERAQDCPADALWGLGDRTHPVRFRPSTVAAIYRLIGEQGHGFHSILKLPSGEVLSCCSELIEGNTAFIIHQMNNRDHIKQNPSLTNRAFLIEHLIQTGITDLVFVRGCRGILHHACRPESGTTIWVIRRSLGSLLCGLVLLTQFPAADIPEKVRAFVTHLFRAPSDRHSA